MGYQSEPETKEKEISTYCNPMDLSYRFSLEEPARREAADPTVVWFKDRYFLFASKSGGYWHSQNLKSWQFVKTDQIPTEEYAPTAIALGDTLYFLASSREKSTIYKSVDPLSGKWSVALEELQIPVWDPAFFLDDDQRLYLYWGCSNEEPIYGVELDTESFAFKGDPLELKHANPEKYGWEVPGDYNTLINQSPWIEGAWINKHNGKYYLQYSGPGTEFKSYSDGVYVSDSPLGPFEAQPHNPFAYRPEGFAAGAGHGSTFQDQYGNYWHLGTITISEKHIFERRLGMYPAFIDENGILYCNTSFGDYPLILPEKKIRSFEEIETHWMLLSLDKEVIVSSSVDSLESANMTDENLRTYWAAETGEKGEYATLDLHKTLTVNAVQINFIEHDVKLDELSEDQAHKFIIETSDDNENWELLVDHSNNKTGRTHNYFELDRPVRTRYLKVTNLEVPGGNFAISGFRVFGKGTGKPPSKADGLTVERNSIDKRSVMVSWNPTQGAMGYNVKYGSHADRLYQNYQVYRDTSITINSLDGSLDYFFTVEAFNQNGRALSGAVISAQ